MDAIGKWFILEALFFTDSSTDSMVLDDLYSPRSLDKTLECYLAFSLLLSSVADITYVPKIFSICVL